MDNVFKPALDIEIKKSYHQKEDCAGKY